MIGVLLLASAISLPSEPPRQASGSICVAPLPKNVRKIDHDEPGARAFREYAYQFTVQIDSSAPVEVPKESPTLMAGFPTGVPHRVAIRDAGKIIERFTFTFERRGADHLCLSYAPGYQTWSLEPPQPGQRWCRCQLGTGSR